MPRRVYQSPRWRVAAFLVLAAATALGFWQLQKTTQALCELRGGLDREITLSEKLLVDIPRGPIFGFPRPLIESSLEDSRRTREALSGLDCN